MPPCLHDERADPAHARLVTGSFRANQTASKKSRNPTDLDPQVPLL